MTRDTSYPRGVGAVGTQYVYDTTDLGDPANPLYRLKIDLNNLVVLNGAELGGTATIGAGVAVYTDILNLIATPYVNPETGEILGWLPDTPGVSEAVISWLFGAVGVNSNSNFGGTFIRDYTIAQVMLREGAAAPTSVQIANAVSYASNLIAQSVAQDILTNGRIPDILTIGGFDAGSVASTVFSSVFGGYYAIGDYAGWAGSLLFPYIGVSQFYDDWILN